MILKALCSLTVGAIFSTQALAAQTWTVGNCSYSETFGEFTTNHKLLVFLLTDGPEREPVGLQLKYNFYSNGAGHGFSDTTYNLNNYGQSPYGWDFFGMGVENINVEGDIQTRNVKGVFMDTNHGEIRVLRDSWMQYFRNCSFNNLSLLSF